MRRLDRYIFREILVPGLIALVALTFVVLIKQGGMLLDIIVRQSPTTAEVWEVLSAHLPLILIVTVPMGVLVGILTGFGRLSSDSEAIAMRASGISMRRILRPVLIFATLAWVLTQSLTAWIAPRTAANLRQRAAALALKYPNIELQPGIFYERVDWALRLNRTQTGNGIQSQGIILADMKIPDRPVFTFAQSGSITPTNNNQTLQLKLENGSTHSLCPPPTEADRPPGCTSSSGHANLYFVSSIFSRDLPVPAPRTRIPVAEVPTRLLWERVQAGTASLDETIEFHGRFALPFACFAFALVGLPLGEI